MKIKRKYLTFVLLGIGLIFIGYGILGNIFEINVDKKIVDNVSTGLMFLAAIVFFYGNKLKKNEAEIKAVFKSEELTDGAEKDSEDSRNIEPNK